jgi:hypothetical protein
MQTQHALVEFCSDFRRAPIACPDIRYIESRKALSDSQARRTANHLTEALIMTKTSQAMSHRTHVLAFAVSLGLLHTTHVSAAPPNFFSDGDFSSLNWASPIIATSGTSTSSSTLLPTGGVPGAHWETTISMATAVGDSLFSLHIQVNSAWNPQADGAIVALNYIEFAQSPSGIGLLTGPLLKQGANYYVRNGLMPTNYSSWTLISASSLDESDFSFVDPSTGSVNISLHPDFSVTGGPIHFGYYQFGLNPLGSLVPPVTTSIDNCSFCLELSTCDSLDFNNDESFPDGADIDDLLSVFNSGPCSTGQCNDIDFNNDCVFPDIADIEAYISAFGDGPCP